MSEEYPEEEYINSENDPTAVEKITKEDYTIVQSEEKIEFEEIFETVRATSEDFALYDIDQTRKVLDSLRRGDFTK